LTILQDIGQIFERVDIVQLGVSISGGDDDPMVGAT
jgi:hypothetical protein